MQNPTQANIADLRRSEDERTSLLEHRSVETQRRASLIFAVDSANVELRVATGQVEVLRRAFKGATDPGRTRGLIVLAGAAAAFLSTMAAIGFDASYQRIRSRRHAAAGAARGLPIVSATELRSDQAYVKRILEMHEPGEAIGIASAFGSSSSSARAVSAVAGSLARTNTRVVTFGEGAAIGGAGERLNLTSLLEHPSTATDELRRRLEDAFQRTSHVHIETDRFLKSAETFDSPTRLRDLIDTAADAADVVLLDCGLTSDASSRWSSFAGVCGLLIVLAEPGRTRQSELRHAITNAWARPVRQVGVSIGIPHVIVTHQRTVAVADR